MSAWAGNLIKLARHDAGLSQRELARRAGTSQATLSAYEAGKKSPSFETLVRIIRAAGRDLRVLLEPLDDHDEWLVAYEAGLPKKTLAARRKHELKVINKARKERGLRPVGARELI
ncbi:MAG: helix-turn-helix domain-containing protein [Actinomycetota bacterium]|nr:helix-turn-helix domain-containing protein [Actinomycetota bacterium]